MSKTIQSRIQHSVYTAAVLKAKNPVLLKGEVVYESDTCKYKIGDGSTAWNTLPYGGGNFEGPISAADITQDTTHRFVTDTEKTTWNGKASTTVATQSANGLMSAADKKKLDGVAAEANNYQHPATHPASVIVQDSTHRFVTDTEKTTWNGKASTAVATQSANGLMSAADKKKLDGVAAGANNYQHPATHPASVIVQDSTHRFVTDTEKTTWNGKASTSVVSQSANGLMSAADKKKLDGITDDILSLPGEGYEEVEIVDQVSMSASGVMVKVVPGFVLFIIKSVQFGGLKTAKFTLPGFIIGSVLTPAAFRAPGGTCTTIYISTATDKTNKCSNIMFSGVDNAGEVTAPLTFAIQATSFSRE